MVSPLTKGGVIPITLGFIIAPNYDLLLLILPFLSTP